MSCDLIGWRRPCPGWNIHCYHHCRHYLYHPHHHHHSISTFSVWDSFETFQFYLDKKDEVERMTLEDFVKSVVSHAEVNLLPPKRWKIVISNSDSDRNGDGDGDGDGDQVMITLQGSMRSELSDLHSLVVPKHKLTRGIFAIFGSLQQVGRPDWGWSWVKDWLSF